MPHPRQAPSFFSAFRPCVRGTCAVCASFLCDFSLPLPKNCKRRTHLRACAMGKCFVPFCKTGYKSCKEKYSLFTPPHDPSRLEAWRRAIPRKDRVLQRTDRVCEKHFAPHFITKTWSAEIDGHVLMSGKRRAGLAKDAVPSIFEGAPTYLSKKIKSPRKQVKRHAHRVALQQALLTVEAAVSPCRRRLVRSLALQE